MNPIGGNIRVKFDPLPLVGGLLMPERYMIQEADKQGELDAYGITTDRRLINPQTCTTDKGERIFVHYGAYEMRSEIGDGTCFIPSRTVLFHLEPIVTPIKGTHVGETVHSDDEKTSWGLILKEGVKEGVKVKIVYGERAGQTVITIDDRQYTFRYEDKNYIYVAEKYIVATEKEGEIYPEQGFILVEYLPDEDTERKAENERRSRLKDFMEKNYLHYPADDLAPIKEPAWVKANCIQGDLKGTVLLNRNTGTPIRNQWIVKSDDILGVIEDASR